MDEKVWVVVFVWKGTLASVSVYKDRALATEEYERLLDDADSLDDVIELSYQEIQ